MAAGFVETGGGFRPVQGLGRGGGVEGMGRGAGGGLKPGQRWDLEAKSLARNQARRAPRKRRTGAAVRRLVNVRVPFIESPDLAGIKRADQREQRQPPVRRLRGLHCGAGGRHEKAAAGRPRRVSP